MKNRIYEYEFEGKTVLCFDTGLNSRITAQARLAQALCRPGTIVYPNGETESWQPESVADIDRSRDGSMIIWGPEFPGEILIDIIADNDSQKEALDILRYWLKARIILENTVTEESSYPGPAGALVITHSNSAKYPLGTIFFPPAIVIKRLLDMEGKEAIINAVSYIHPDIEEKAASNREEKNYEGIAYTAAAMLYRIFCASHPFLENKITSYSGEEKRSPVLDNLRQDIREAVFVPPDLAAPGLDTELADLINRAMAPVVKIKTKGKKKVPIPLRPDQIRPGPEYIRDFIGAPYTKDFSSWFNNLNDESITLYRQERDVFIKKSERKVRHRRFVRQYSTRIAVLCSLVIAIVLGIQSYQRHQATLPNTIGMSALEVVDTYYNALGGLDHMLMEACVLGRVGRRDIDMVVTLYVTIRTRQAQEPDFIYISARRWEELGFREDILNVFGVTDLETRILRSEEESVFIEAEYLLWMPGYVELIYHPSDLDMLDPRIVMNPPTSTRHRDVLELVWHRDTSWRINEISRFDI